MELGIAHNEIFFYFDYLELFCLEGQEQDSNTLCDVGSRNYLTTYLT